MSAYPYWHTWCQQKSLRRWTETPIFRHTGFISFLLTEKIPVVQFLEFVQVLTDPPVLFCDEPTTGLDAFSAERLVLMLKGLFFYFYLQKENYLEIYFNRHLRSFLTWRCQKSEANFTQKDFHFRVRIFLPKKTFSEQIVGSLFLGFERIFLQRKKLPKSNLKFERNFTSYVKFFECFINAKILPKNTKLYMLGHLKLE